MLNYTAKHRAALILWLLVLCQPALAENGKSGTENVFRGPTMGTSYTIKVVDLPEDKARVVEAGIKQNLQRINQLMSTYIAGSEISRLNRFAANKPFDISLETYRVLTEATAVSRLTGGAFDVTISPLVDLWGFGSKSKHTDNIPTDKQLSDTLAKIGYQKLQISDKPYRAIKSTKALEVNLSAVAKGFGVDYVADYLESQGIKQYMVEVGGELRTLGQNASGNPWTIAIESPISGIRKIQRVIHLTNLGMATSGDYRNYFEKNGKRYSHIIDPRTGRPVTHNLASATILHPSCMHADALATSVIVLGLEEGFKLVQKEKLPALLIYKSKKGFVEKMTPEFRKILQK